jgi:hypothetical protein
MNLPALLAAVAVAAFGGESGSCRQARHRFALEQVPLALSWHGTAAMLHFQPEGLPGRAAVYLAGSSLCYLSTQLVTRCVPLNEVQAHMGTALAYRGILTGHGLDAWLKFKPWSNRVLAMWLGSVAGEVGGLILARNLSLGQAELVLTGADFGTLQGLCVGTAVNDLVFHDSLWHASPSVGILPGQMIGAAAGLVAARYWKGTEGQAQLMRAGSLVGAALPATAYLVATGGGGRREQSIAAGLASAGSITGTLLVAWAVRERALPAGNGWRLVGAGVSGMVAGTVAGFGAYGEAGAAATAGLIGAGTRLATELLLIRVSTYGQGDLSQRLYINIDALGSAVAEFGQRGWFAAPKLVVVRF